MTTNRFQVTLHRSLSLAALSLASLCCSQTLSVQAQSELATTTVASPEAAPAPGPTPEPFERATQLLEKHCNDCHGAEKPEANLNLVDFDSVEKIVANRHTWDHVRQRVFAGEMPPRDVEPMPVEDRQWLANWVETTFREVACQGNLSPGPNPLRRLNRNQFSNTVRDLLAIHFDAGHSLPADGAGGEGFDNAAETLFLSPIHGEKYLEAAKDAVSYAAKNATSRELIFIATPSDQLPADQAAQKIIDRFVTRAFRRPAQPAEVEKYLSLYRAATSRGLAFDESIYFAIQAILISPNMLFMVEPELTEDHPTPVDNFSLATRLSYFLWDSMPDDELYQRAADGSLAKDEVLREQVVRMLKSERTREMAESFMGQWLGTRELGRQIKPEGSQFPNFDDELAAAFREEPVLMLQDILKENRSLLEFITSDYVYANGEMFSFYDLKDNRPENLNQQLLKVQLPPGHARGGILTMAGPLTVSSYPNRTSPVLRGKWVLETILGTPPPAPPPNVDPLSEKPGDVAGKTLRQRLELHRQNPTCAACHERLDPIGFGLENFDAIGHWRDTDNGLPVDAHGQLASGEQFSGATELKQLVMQRKDQFIRHVTIKLLAYALGRGLVDSDYCAVDNIVADLRNNNYESQRLIFGIINSLPMKMRPAKPIPAADPVAAQ